MGASSRWMRYSSHAGSRGRTGGGQERPRGSMAGRGEAALEPVPTPPPNRPRDWCFRCPAGGRRSPRALAGQFKCGSTGEPRAPTVGTMLLVSALWLATNRRWAGPAWCPAPQRLVPRPRTGRAGFGAGVIARRRCPCVTLTECERNSPLPALRGGGAAMAARPAAPLLIPGRANVVSARSIRKSAGSARSPRRVTRARAAAASRNSPARWKSSGPRWRGCAGPRWGPRSGPDGPPGPLRPRWPPGGRAALPAVTPRRRTGRPAVADRRLSPLRAAAGRRPRRPRSVPPDGRAGWRGPACG